MTNIIFEQLCKDQCSRWPRLTAQDLTKALYQAEFGCGHFVADRERGLNWLIDEEKSLASAPREVMPPMVEPLGEAYCRVHLAHMAEFGLTAETLFSLFALSAETPSGDMAHFKALLNQMEEMIAAGTLPVDPTQAHEFLAVYRVSGCPSTHHSETFRKAYVPAYRVVRAEYARFLPLFAAIDRKMQEKERVIVAIEGGSASGKSTLGELLTRVYGCTLFHMDDFFLQMHQRTPERFQEPGGNVDRERFREEVINPLLRGGEFDYRVFDCSQMALGDTVHVRPGRLCVIEGAYSMHPDLSDAYDLSCFVKIDPAEQAARILKRNGAKMQQRFLNEWIPLEHAYFDALNVKERCTLIL